MTTEFIPKKNKILESQFFSLKKNQKFTHAHKQIRIMFSLIVTQDPVVLPWFKEGRCVTKTCVDNSYFHFSILLSILWERFHTTHT